MQNVSLFCQVVSLTEFGHSLQRLAWRFLIGVYTNANNSIQE